MDLVGQKTPGGVQVIIGMVWYHINMCLQWFHVIKPLTEIDNGVKGKSTIKKPWSGLQGAWVNFICRHSGWLSWFDHSVQSA